MRAVAPARSVLGGHAVIVLVAVCAAVAAGGCGYGLVGTGAVLLPPDVRRIAVPVFENRTERPGIEQWLSEAVAREIAARGALDVPASIEAADAVLEGIVESYMAWPTTLDEAGRATEYQIVVVSTARLRSREGSVLLEIDHFRFQERYEVTLTAGGYSDLENVAVEELSERFAESLVAALLEGF